MSLQFLRVPEMMGVNNRHQINIGRDMRAGQPSPEKAFKAWYAFSRFPQKGGFLRLGLYHDAWILTRGRPRCAGHGMTVLKRFSPLKG
jgi:hypothetical protein